MQKDVWTLPKELTFQKSYEGYLRELLDKTAAAYEIAQKARRRGYDPVNNVEMEIASDIPSVVEAMVGPEGVAERIRELMREGKETEEISIIIAKEIAEGEFGQKDLEERANQAVKTALSISTGGITAAPLEGVTKVTVREDEHLAIYYAGPIRSAGGTETALSVLIADIVRKTLNLKKYEIPEKVKERIIEETILYDRHRSLQFPVEKEKLAFALEHLTVEVNGEGSTEIKVSGPYRRVQNVKTPRLRSGVALVVNDGIIGKAKKLLKIVSHLNIEGWDWLKDLEKVGRKERRQEESEKGEKTEETVAYMQDIVVGRPVFSFPSRVGGFRLRYGRARNTGLAALGLHPATMYLLNDFLATGTQIKTEKPGKAAVTLPIDSIMPPIVRLRNGDVIKVHGVEQAKAVKDEIEEILFLGDLLSAVGEFFENNQEILPSPIVDEWWEAELKSAVKDHGWEKSDLSVTELIERGGNDPAFSFELTEKLGIPLHPKYTYFWRNINGKEMQRLKEAITEGKETSLKHTEEVKKILENLLVPHTLKNSEIKLEKADMEALRETLRRADLSADLERDGLEILEHSLEVKDKYPIFVGARMGRPEKAKSRKLSPSIHVLFPMGKSGAKNRSIKNAAKKGKRSKVEARSRYCPECDKITYKNKCPDCGKRTVKVKVCRKCGKKFLRRDFCPSCNMPLRPYKEYTMEFSELLNSGIEKLGMSYPPEVKGVKGLTSKNKVPEPLEKGILRGKEGVYVFKDGTARFDATDLPLTHFKPSEIETSVETIRQLGYGKDVEGRELENPPQLVELKPQDIIISEKGLQYLSNVANFVDGLLEKFYGLEPYYNLSEPSDLIGKLVIGMAPHTSSGIIGRIIGITRSQGIYAHPYWHAAKRRNCFHPDTRIWVKGEKGAWEYKEIKGFVEGKLEPRKAKEDDFGTLYQEIEEDIYVPSINKQGEPVTKRINAISKHQSTDHLLEITTRGGRVVKVTPDHSMVKWGEGEIEKVEARELSVGDKIPIPKSLPPKGRKKEIILFEAPPKTIRIETFQDSEPRDLQLLADGGGSCLDEISCIDLIKSDVEHTYSLTVEETHTLVANDLYTGQCDGDEDAVILLLDGLINFSEKFLPDTRGGRMDAPLVIRTILKPEIVDAEVFNMELTDRLPLEFYRKSQDTMKLGVAESVIEKVEDRLGTEEQFYDFSYNISTEDISKGPKLSSYKKLGNMEEKADKQLKTMSKISAVDTKEVASRIISDHLLPDVIGNLRAFGRQNFRCVQCNKKFKTWPLIGKCPNCGGRVILTVSRGGITKYLGLVEKIIENYDVSDYVKSRFEIIKRTDIDHLKRPDRLGNAIKKAKVRKENREKYRGKTEYTVKKEKRIKIEDYL